MQSDNCQTGLEMCPFCGGQAQEDEIEDGGSVIFCTACGASSPVHYDRKENLYPSWNQRPLQDNVYRERNQVVAGLAALAVAMGFRAGTARTDIPGWDPEWHGCVYIDLPTGQVSWHYHDRDAHLFDFLLNYHREWDGHDTPEKYRRVLALRDLPPREAAMFSTPAA